jgi:hypothetical protein
MSRLFYVNVCNQFRKYPDHLVSGELRSHESVVRDDSANKLVFLEPTSPVGIVNYKTLWSSLRHWRDREIA